MCYGGAQTLFEITPDLTTLGKIIGGGLPVAAYGGRRDLMDRVAPLGPVYQAGTLSGNPLAMSAGIASLDLLAAPGFYESLDARAKRLGDGIVEVLRESKVPATAVRSGSLLTLFFSHEPVTDYAAAKKCDTRRFAEFFRGMLDRGVFIAPSQFEALFVSAAHTDEDIDRTLAACTRELSRNSGMKFVAAKLGSAGVSRRFLCNTPGKALASCRNVAAKRNLSDRPWT